jgi:hypothetical protein
LGIHVPAIATGIGVVSEPVADVVVCIDCGGAKLLGDVEGINSAFEEMADQIVCGIEHEFLYLRVGTLAGVTLGM